MIVSCRTVFLYGITTHVFYYSIVTSYQNEASFQNLHIRDKKILWKVQCTSIIISQYLKIIEEVFIMVPILAHPSQSLKWSFLLLLMSLSQTNNVNNPTNIGIWKWRQQSRMLCTVSIYPITAHGTLVESTN